MRQFIKENAIWVVLGVLVVEAGYLPHHWQWWAWLIVLLVSVLAHDTARGNA